MPMDAEERARRAVELMGAHGSRVAIVAEGDAVQGVLRMDKLAELLRKR